MLGSLVLTACGNGGSDDTHQADGGTNDFNSADVTFARQMIPHHQQAVLMSKMAADNASAPQVKALATKIEAAQAPEIDTMQGWLEAWGKTEDSEPGDHDDHGMGSDMGHGDDSDMGMDSDTGSDMPGMMSDADLGKLGKAHARGFDRMYLQMMIRHHEGAIEMAKTEQAKGKNAVAVALAKKIAAAQTTEIATMRQLLGG